MENNLIFLTSKYQFPLETPTKLSQQFLTCDLKLHILLVTLTVLQLLPESLQQIYLTNDIKGKKLACLSHKGIQSPLGF